MRTLNRPMFRYGGPIKEGVMHGIREPKRNGGSMTQRVQPSNDGSRPGYAGPLLAAPAIGAGIMTAGRAGLRYIPRGINYLKNIFQTQKPAPYSTVKIGQSKGGKLLNLKPKVIRNVKDIVPKENVGTVFQTRPYFANDPLVATGSKIIQGITSPTSKGLIQKGARLVTSPTGVLTGLYLGGKYYNKDGKEIKKPKGSTIDSKKPGQNSDMYYKEPEKELTEAEKAKIESDNRIKQMDKYREIMDIKGMSKDAAYKSLIDAGKIIREGGNLKEQLKSGKLITNLTQAASKRFDKVGDTEAALRSLVAKGEITKEMNKEDKALTNELIRKKIEVANKQLSGDTFLEKVEKFTLASKGTPPSGSTLANLMRTSEIRVDEIADTTAVLNWLGKNKGKDEIDYIVDQVKVGVANGTPLDAGVYVVRDRIVIIDENGNVKPGPI